MILITFYGKQIKLKEILIIYQKFNLKNIINVKKLGKDKHHILNTRFNTNKFFQKKYLSYLRFIFFLNSKIL